MLCRPFFLAFERPFVIIKTVNYAIVHTEDVYKRQEEELEELYKSRYDYRKFLRKFAFPREEIQLDEDSFDYIFYNFGMEQYGNLPLIEPLEYKEVNRLEELVIAIDTSGSCSREMVRRFLGETYQILSTRENFFKKMKVYIVQCDCCIQWYQVIHSEEEWKEYMQKITIQGLSLIHI